MKKDGSVPRCLLELLSGDPTQVQTPKVFPRLLSHHLDQLDLIGEMLNIFTISSCCANGCNLKRKPKDTLSFCQEPNKPLDPVTASISPGCVEHLGKRGPKSRRRRSKTNLTRSSTSRPLALLESLEAIATMLDNLKLLIGSFMTSGREISKTMILGGLVASVL